MGVEGLVITAEAYGGGDTARLANSITSRRGAQYERERRNSTSLASTSAGF